MNSVYWVYVLQSLTIRTNKKGQRLPGFFYVGMTTDPARRLRQHNGEISGGGRYTSKWRVWEMRAIFGPYETRSDALKAEYALKHGKRGAARLNWTPQDSPWCRGLGILDVRCAPACGTSGEQPAPARALP
jgi:predicted GIY-YIG superfamily endonuclease